MDINTRGRALFLKYLKSYHEMAEHETQASMEMKDGMWQAPPPPPTKKDKSIDRDAWNTRINELTGA